MAYTSPPPTAEPLLKEKPFGVCISRHIQAVTFSLIRLAIRSTPCPQFGIVVFEQIIVQILVASLSLRPPYSATGRGGTPAPVWEKAFIVMRFTRNITGLSNNRK